MKLDMNRVREIVLGVSSGIVVYDAISSGEIWERLLGWGVFVTIIMFSERGE